MCLWLSVKNQDQQKTGHTSRSWEAKRKLKMEPAVVEPESLPVCAQVLKWNLGAGKDAQSVDSCVELVMDGDDA